MTKWTEAKNSWHSEGRRITKLGLEGDERRYAAYSDGKYLGSEDTFNEARKLALSGKVKKDAVRDEDDGIPRFAQLSEEERREGWKKNPPRAATMSKREVKEVDPSTKAYLEERKREAFEWPAPKKAKKEKAARPSREGLITVGSIAAELGIEAGDARAMLRKAGVAKPEAGWCGDDKWAIMIKKTIKKGLT